MVRGRLPYAGLRMDGTWILGQARVLLGMFGSFVTLQCSNGFANGWISSRDHDAHEGRTFPMECGCGRRTSLSSPVPFFPVWTMGSFRVSRRNAKEGTEGNGVFRSFRLVSA